MKININWRNLGISIVIGLILVILFIVLFGISAMDVFCNDNDDNSLKTLGESEDYFPFCEITTAVVISVSIAIFLPSMILLYLFLGHLEKRKSK